MSRYFNPTKLDVQIARGFFDLPIAKKGLGRGRS